MCILGYSLSAIITDSTTCYDNTSSNSIPTTVSIYTDQNATISTELCHCNCNFSEIITTTAPEVLNEIDLEFINELKVKKEELSSEIRKKVSASDPRSSSKVIGYFAIMILTLMLSFILALDFIPP